MTSIIRGCLGPVLVAALSAVPLASSSFFAASPRLRTEAPSQVIDVLRQAGLSAAEIRTVETGEAVARLIDTDRRQVAVAGAVRIKASRDRLVERFRTIDFLKGSKAVIDAGQFSNPPRPSDLNAVPFEPYDLDLRTCRPGDCRVRLSEADITRFQREVNWESPTWSNESSAIWREVLGSYVAGYVRAGAKTLPVYANKEEPLPVADEQALLLKETAFVGGLAPGLLEHLRNPAARPLPRAEGLIYWSKEDFGIRPVLRITYQAIYAGGSSSDQPRPPVVISTNQLYAAHYMDAAVGFMIALEPPQADAANGFYLVAVNRARTRSLSGLVRTVARSTVQKRSRSGLEKLLRSAKEALERQETASLSKR